MNSENQILHFLIIFQINDIQTCILAFVPIDVPAVHFTVFILLKHIFYLLLAFIIQLFV